MKKEKFPDDSDFMGVSEKDQRGRSDNSVDSSQENFDSTSTDVLYSGHGDSYYPTGSFDEFH